jgi:hypothetical protein
VVDEEKPAVFGSPSAIDPNSVRVVKTKTLDRRHVDTSDTRRHRGINTRDQETPHMRRVENLAKCDDFLFRRWPRWLRWLRTSCRQRCTAERR